MNNIRILHWDGCTNVRDLGGLPASEGRQTRWRAVVRADNPFKLTARGWEALWEYGIRTIITLRTEGMSEYDIDPQVIPAGIELLSVAVEDLGDKEFLHKWAATDLWSTPLYYQDALQRWPQRHAQVVQAFARAQPGGVLIHCVSGKDRTGIISLLLLALAGVADEAIAADYQLSADPERDEILRQRNTTSRAVILETLAGLEIDNYLLAAGLSPETIAAARERLLA